MLKEVYTNLEEKMKKTIEATRKEFTTIRTGRATPALLERIMVDYYGTPTPVNQVAKISVPEARTLLIQPWDKSTIALIEKAILKSDLGLTPNNDGVAIRLALPQLTREKRTELVKVVKKRAEDGKVGIRNIRRDGNEEVKALEKKKLVTEDEVKKAQDDIQKLTDRYIKEVDSLVEAKEKEIMEV